jgi:glycosyltransferase involved in cell wall biosynthesis
MGKKTIQETIESVLNQTFTDFELIVINDGSQDATLEIVERIQDPRLKAFSYPMLVKRQVETEDFPTLVVNIFRL